MRGAAICRLMGLLAPVMLATSALGLCAAQGGAAEAAPLRADGDQVERIYDLRAILSAAALHPPNVILFLHLATGWVDSQEPDSYDIEHGPEGSLSLRSCVHLLRAGIEADERAELTELLVRAGHVRVTGNQAAHSAARRVIEALQAGVLDSVSVEVYRLDDARIPRTVDSVLGRSAATALVAGLGDAFAARERVLLGRAVLLGDSGKTTFLSDYDVDSSGTFIAADPVISTISMGLELGVRIDRASDGKRFVVRMWGRDGELFRPISTTESLGASTSKIELPRVATSLWVASAIIEPGGAIVIDHDGGGESALILRIPAVGATATPESILPLGELALPPLRPVVAGLPAASPSGGWPIFDDEGWFESAKWSAGVAISAVLEDEFADLIRQGLMRMHGTALLLPRGDLMSQDVRDRVDEFRTAHAVPTIALDLRYDFLEPQQVAGAISPEGVAKFAASATGRLLGAAVEGDAILLVGGRESSYLTDHDSQIGSSAMYADPIMDEFFEGVSIWCAPLRDVGGMVSAWFDVRVQTSDGTPRRIETLLFIPEADLARQGKVLMGSFKKALAIQLPVTRRATARTFIRSNDREWALVTVRPLAGTGRTLVVVARLSVM